VLAHLRVGSICSLVVTHNISDIAVAWPADKAIVLAERLQSLGKVHTELGNVLQVFTPDSSAELSFRILYRGW
jgi:hypothetical protein